MLEQILSEKAEKPPSSLRGIAPPLLLNQVWNTAPYLKSLSVDEPQRFPFLWILQNTSPEDSLETLKWQDYFQLCVAAHYATVATFVPTDVDVHIRQKLWRPQNPPLCWEEEILPEMMALVKKAFSWDATWISARWLQTPSGKLLEGHKGEWLSLAAAALGASRHTHPQSYQEVFSMIEHELALEETCFQEFLEHKDWMSLLKASVLISHNLGDLERVLEAWGLPQLFQEHFNRPLFLKAGQINRELMALENHRHFALREPRPLRKNLDFLLPLGPFLDDWGKELATHPDLSLDEMGKILEALIQGFYRLKGPVGYARALVGIENHYPGGLSELTKPLPSKVTKLWTSGSLRTQCSLSQLRFEAQWIKKCQSVF